MKTSKRQRRSLHDDIQEDITNIKICALNIGDCKYIKKILRTLKEDSNTVTIELDTPLQKENQYGYRIFEQDYTRLSELNRDTEYSILQYPNIQSS